MADDIWYATRGHVEPLVWGVTRSQIEDRARRPVTDEEAARIGRAIGNSTVWECVDGAIEQVCGLPEDEEDEDGPGYPCVCGYAFAARWERQAHWDNAGDGRAHGIPVRGKEGQQ